MTTTTRKATEIKIGDQLAFHADDLKYLGHLSEKVGALTEWYGARLVVAVWDKGDQRPIAWVECHPDDSNATVRFGPEQPDQDTPISPGGANA